MTTMYFAHPTNVYNTPLEKKLLAEIKDTFPSPLIENPNQPHHHENYQRWRREKGNGMLYFLQEVLPDIDQVIALPFPDKRFGKGVAREVLFFLERNKPAWEITPSGIIFPLLSLKRKRILTIEQTKQRIYIDGDFSKGIKPYE